jgi:hypothetical protein
LRDIFALQETGFARHSPLSTCGWPREQDHQVTKPADLPGERPIKLERVIKLHTATKSSASRSRPLLLRADQTIE